MSEHCGYIVKLNEIHPHSNADRLQIATIFGASVIVDLSAHEGDIGVFFPIDLQLSEEYCKENDLVRRKDENGNPCGGYLDPDKRNIRALKLRGEKSEGLFMPLKSLTYTGVTKYEVGEKIEILNGHEICRKYIPRGKKHAAAGSTGNRTRKRHVPIAPFSLRRSARPRTAACPTRGNCRCTSPCCAAIQRFPPRRRRAAARRRCTPRCLLSQCCRDSVFSGGRCRERSGRLR